jgi:hypothetical protein
MAYIVEEWDYSEDEELLKEVAKWLLDRKKFLIVIDSEKDDSVVFVSHDENIERDMKQAEAIRDALNER